MIYLKRYKSNPLGRDFVCGDLHGQLTQLYQAMEQQSFDRERDRLFCVGDLIDRGKSSKQAFELILEPWFHSIRGNHEAMMFQAYQTRNLRDFHLWMNNGGRDWIKDEEQFFQTEESFTELVAEQLESLPWVIELELKDGRRLGLIHAECPVNDWDKLEPLLREPEYDGAEARRDALWGRHIKDPLFGEPVIGIDLTVHGHTIFPEPVRRANRCYIDTGACLQNGGKWRLLRRRQKNQGFLSLLPVESLFDLPESDWQTLMELLARFRR